MLPVYRHFTLSSFDLKTGYRQWHANMISDLHGFNAVYGYSMPVLVEKDQIYCYPGGADTNVASLNRNTGKIIWCCCFFITHLGPVSVMDEMSRLYQGKPAGKSLETAVVAWGLVESEGVVTMY